MDANTKHVSDGAKLFVRCPEFQFTAQEWGKVVGGIRCLSLKVTDVEVSFIDTNQSIKV